MSTKFKALVAEEAKNLPEVLEFGGSFPGVTVKTAIDLDWVGSVADAQSDLVLYARHTSPDDAVYRRRMMQKTLARMVAICEAWEGRL